MTDSMIWNAMTTSMQLAQECLKEGPSTGEEQAEASPPFEGLESFAQTIESGMYIIISVHIFQVQLLLSNCYLPIDHILFPAGKKNSNSSMSFGHAALAFFVCLGQLLA